MKKHRSIGSYTAGLCFILPLVIPSILSVRGESEAVVMDLNGILSAGETSVPQRFEDTFVAKHSEGKVTSQKVFTPEEKRALEEEVRARQRLSATPSDVVVAFDNEDIDPKFDPNAQISVDFVNQDVKQVLRHISELYDLNIVIPETLSGAVSLRLRNASWEAILEAALSSTGYTYINSKNIIQVLRIDDLTKEPITTIAIPLKHCPAQQVLESLRGVITAESEGNMAVDERSNLLIVTDTPTRLKLIQQLVAQIDQPEKQVMIEAKFIEVSESDTRNLGIKYDTPIKFSVSQDANRPSRLLFNFGFNVAGEVHHSQTTADGRILSSPTIVTMNNVPAEISVGEQYPVPNYTYNERQDRFAVSGFEEKDVGIALKVTPKIQDEFVTLKIEPQLTEKTGDVSFGGNATNSVANIPIVSQKKVVSTVTVKSGYTVAIGGLLSEKNYKNVDKVPFFSQIPLIGKLFSRHNREKRSTNLLIFLTATQLAQDGTLIQTEPFRGVHNVRSSQVESMGITDRDLPGYRGEKEEEILRSLMRVSTTPTSQDVSPQNLPVDNPGPTLSVETSEINGLPEEHGSSHPNFLTTPSVSPPPITILDPGSIVPEQASQHQK
jgi:type II secretory pathway component GspD/PulD (secretin)